MGDFNLDSKMEFRNDYHRKVQLSLLTEFALGADLKQVIKFSTWSRTVNSICKESLIDHMYVNNPALIGNV